MRFLLSIMAVAMLFTASCAVEQPFSQASSSSDDDGPDTNWPAYEAMYDATKVHTITLEFTPQEWTNLLLDFSANTNNEIKRLAHFKFNFDGSSSNEWVSNVGIKCAGNYSRQIPEDGGIFFRFHLSIDFNNTFDDDEGIYGQINLPFLSNNKGRRFRALRTMRLKNDNSDPSMMLEAFAYCMMRDAGVPAMRTTFANLIIQIGNTNINFGTYKVMEQIDESYLKKRFGGMTSEPEYGDLYKCLWQDYNGGASLTVPSLTEWSYSGNVNPPIGMEITDPLNARYRPTYDLKNNKTNLESTTHVAFKAFINGLATANKAWLDANLDVTNCLKVMAIDMLTGMGDSYWGNVNNYYLYQNIKTGKWVLIPYDYDNTFGISDSWFGDTTNKAYDGLGPVDSSRPLVQKLFAYYKPLYNSIVSNYMRTLYTVSNANAFMAVKSKFDPAVNWQAVDRGIAPNFTYDYADYMTNRIASAAVQMGLQPSVFLGGPSYVANNSVMYVRGDVNGWGSTPMALVNNFTWRVTINITSTGSQGYKFANTTDWSGTDWGDNPPADGIADNPGGSTNNIFYDFTTAGNYTFTFNDSNLTYSVAP